MRLSPRLAWCRWLAAGMVGLLQGLSALADTTSGWEVEDKRLGLGWWHYSEPGMRLQGPALTGQLTLRSPDGRMAPGSVGGDIMLARLAYGSDSTGTLSGVPAVGWRVHLLWHMPLSSGAPWQLGVQYEGLWNDLQGRTSTGHLGYERLSNRLWLHARAAPWAETELQLGLLLRGWQDSYLSQADGRLADVTNVQNRGFQVVYRHRPWSLGGRPVSTWIRYTHISRSDEAGAQRWYEPRNRTIALGLETRF